MPFRALPQDRNATEGVPYRPYVRQNKCELWAMPTLPESCKVLIAAAGYFPTCTLPNSCDSLRPMSGTAVSVSFSSLVPQPR